MTQQLKNKIMWKLKILLCEQMLWKPNTNNIFFFLNTN